MSGWSVGVAASDTDTWRFSRRADAVLAPVVGRVAVVLFGVLAVLFGTFGNAMAQSGDPNAPQNMRVVEEGDGWVKVAWEPPQTEAGPSLSGYILFYLEVRSTPGSQLGDPEGWDPKFLGADTRESTLTGLTNNVWYALRVGAISPSGYIAPSEVVLARPGLGSADGRVPGPPSNVRTPGVPAGQSTVVWEPPADDGGSPITGYEVWYREKGSGMPWSRSGGSLGSGVREHVISGLPGGIEFGFAVAAVNQSGRGPAATTLYTTIESVNPGTTTPPDNGTETPPDNGTETPPDNGTETPPDNGTETPPDSGAVPGSGVPAAPRNVRVVEGDGWLRVAWDPPEDEPSPEGYVVHWWEVSGNTGGSGSSGLLGADTREWTASGLANGVRYVLKVSAFLGEFGSPSEFVFGNPGSGSVAESGAPADAGVHQPSIEALEEHIPGIFDGTGCEQQQEGLCPDEPLRRWEMAVWLVRVLDQQDPADRPAQRFEDVPADQWWAPYTDRLAELEVTIGCATQPPRYCPDQEVTRAQMATFLTRAFDLEPGPPAGFADTEGNTHQANIDALAHARITAGCKTGPPRYCPDQAVTRAQMATFLARALGLIQIPPPSTP